MLKQLFSQPLKSLQDLANDERIQRFRLKKASIEMDLCPHCSRPYKVESVQGGFIPVCEGCGNTFLRPFPTVAAAVAAVNRRDLYTESFTDEEHSSNAL